MRAAVAGTVAVITTLALVSGCQEYTITKPDPIIDEPVDTDVEPPPTPGADIEVEPMELDFGYLPQGCPADDQQITVRNVGGEALTITNIALQGPDSAVFTLAVNPRTLQPGEQLRATVGFTAPQLATYNRVKVVVESDDRDEPRVDVPMFGAGAEAGIHEQAWLQTQASAVDVLWVIDNSGSMSDEIDELSRRFQTFISSFVNLGLDYHIAVTTTDMDQGGAQGRFVGPVITNGTRDPVSEFTSQTTQGFGGSATERGRQAAYAALTAPLVTGANAGFLRQDANLAIVVVSDEDDSSSSPAVGQFNNWLNNLKGDPNKTSFSGMVGPDGTGLFACTLGGGADASFAPRYHDVIRGTRGVWGDICQFEIDVFLTFLSYAAAGLLFEFDLDFQPSNIGDVVVKIDGVVIPYSAFNGWTYDSRNNSVVLNGNAVPGPGAVIEIEYPYLTSCP